MEKVACKTKRFSHFIFVLNSQFNILKSDLIHTHTHRRRLFCFFSSFLFNQSKMFCCSFVSIMIMKIDLIIIIAHTKLNLQQMVKVNAMNAFHFHFVYFDIFSKVKKKNLNNFIGYNLC